MDPGMTWTMTPSDPSPDAPPPVSPHARGNGWELTEAERQQRRLKVIQLLRAGYPYHEVAERTGLTTGGVSQLATRLGLARTGGQVASMDPELLARIKVRYLAGVSLRRLGREFGLSRTALFRLDALWRPEREAQQQALVRSWVDAFEQGQSVKAIAAQAGQSPYHVRHVLQQHLAAKPPKRRLMNWERPRDAKGHFLSAKGAPHATTKHPRREPPPA